MNSGSKSFHASNLQLHLQPSCQQQLPTPRCPLCTRYKAILLAKQKFFPPCCCGRTSRNREMLTNNSHNSSIIHFVTANPKSGNRCTPLKKPHSRAQLDQMHEMDKGRPKLQSQVFAATLIPPHRSIHHVIRSTRTNVVGMWFVPRPTTRGVPTTQKSCQLWSEKYIMEHASILFRSDNSPSTASHTYFSSQSCLLPVFSCVFNLDLLWNKAVQVWLRPMRLRPRNSEGICPFWHRKVLPPSR